MIADEENETTVSSFAEAGIEPAPVGTVMSRTVTEKVVVNLLPVMSITVRVMTTAAAV